MNPRRALSKTNQKLGICYCLLQRYRLLAWLAVALQPQNPLLKLYNKVSSPHGNKRGRNFTRRKQSNGRLNITISEYGNHPKPSW